MNRLGPSLTAFALLAAAAAPAAAQDRTPVITELRDGNDNPAKKLPQGGVLWIRGRNLHKCPEPPADDPGKKVNCQHDAIKVTLDGQRLHVLSSDFDLTIAQIPPKAQTGRRTIKVKVDGQPGEAKAQIEIVSMKEWTNDSGMQNAESGGGQTPDAQELILKQFKITRFQMVAGNAGSRFDVEGLARGMPDEFRVSLTLRYDNRDIRQRDVAIEDGGFKTTFGPFKEKLLYGIYECELVFSLPAQDRLLKRRWEREQRKNGEKPLSAEQEALYQKILRRELASVGTGPQGKCSDEDRERQKTELQAHTKELIDGAVALLDEVEQAWAVAYRCRYKEQGKSSYEIEKYKEWLIKRGYAADAAGADAIVKKTTYATGSGHFKPTEWEEWLTAANTGLLPRLKALHDKHVAFNTAYICPMDNRAHMLGDYLVSIVLHLVKERTNDLCFRSNVPAPKSIKDYELRLMVAPDISTKFFHAKKRELQRQVELPVS